VGGRGDVERCRKRKGSVRTGRTNEAGDVTTDDIFPRTPLTSWSMSMEVFGLLLSAERHRQICPRSIDTKNPTRAFRVAIETMGAVQLDDHHRIKHSRCRSVDWPWVLTYITRCTEHAITICVAQLPDPKHGSFALLERTMTRVGRRNSAFLQA
jgi:hypothetical protein